MASFAATDSYIFIFNPSVGLICFTCLMFSGIWRYFVSFTKNFHKQNISLKNYLKFTCQIISKQFSNVRKSLHP